MLLSSTSDNESCSRHTVGRNVVSVNCLKLDCCRLGIKTKEPVDLTLQDSTLRDLGRCQEKTSEGDEIIPETPNAKRSVSNEGDDAAEPANLVEFETSLLLEESCINGMRDENLSPRLTNFIRSGVVPESPIDERGESLQGHNMVVYDV